MKIKKIKGSEEYFCEGVIHAVAMLYRLNGKASMGAYILKEAGLEVWDCSDLDEFDQESLRFINNEKGMKLKGLNPKTRKHP